LRETSDDSIIGLIGIARPTALRVRADDGRGDKQRSNLAPLIHDDLGRYARRQASAAPVATAPASARDRLFSRTTARKIG
jgi:hypothetical protein